MKRLLPLALVAAAMTTVAAPARAQDTKDQSAGALTWKLAKGDKVRYAYSYQVERGVEVMGMPLNQTTKLTLHLSEEVTDAAGGTATVQATIDRIIVDADLGPMGGGAMAFDTKDWKPKAEKPKAKKKDKKGDDDEDDDDDSNPLEGLNYGVGKTFTFKVASDGAVSDVTGLEDVIKTISEKAHVGEGMSMPKEGDMAGAARMMQKMALPSVLVFLSPQVVQQTLDLHCHVFPAKATGDSWALDTSEQIPGMGQIDFKRTIAVKGEAQAAGEKGAKLEQTATTPTFKPVAAGTPGAAGPMGAVAAAMGKLKMTDGSFNGTATFSREKGRLLGDELVEKCTLEGKMPNLFGPQKKKAGGDDDDDDDDAPKKKDAAKKDDSKKDAPGTKDGGKKDDSKKGDDEGEGEGMKLTQKITLKLRYEILTGDAAKPAETPAPEKKGDQPKKDDKGSF